MKERQEVLRIKEKNELKQKRMEQRSLIPPVKKSMDRSLKPKLSIKKKEKAELSEKEKEAMKYLNDETFKLPSSRQEKKREA